MGHLEILQQDHEKFDKNGFMKYYPIPGYPGHILQVLQH